ncbi:hypothetical protein Asp14428_76370 [Actinoplanes sp. NBRC 14428]|uniref:Cyclase/cyclase n=1 Tax=Pseudosporangium ferrugineum TaxID=439699 RepID=A0A2T0RXA4_9ACTN|nr:TcmI family type II polyketide cyclase [Pseudosporangium ferrugineum]PRY25788.1 cyclase/cyclase [Pseudosporangium ferrugineum]BCJ56162.1 hypothetical protein Asp14428_76370 [Actinoplanes sp. NBRC 14428]
MSDRSLIVARLNPGGSPEIAKLFAESDSGELPNLLGVRRRHLFAYRDLYFHYVEFEGERHEALRAAAGRQDFRELSVALDDHVTPYDPATWRSPADAMATEFYRWTPATGPEVVQ